MYQICVSGAARGKSVEEGKHLATATGKAIARHGHAVMTGATIGLPYYAAQGAFTEMGQSVGISPAATRHGHVDKYRLPTDAYDVMLFTGLHYVGRDLLLIQTSDAVVSIGGRIGTLHEFTIAMETGKPIAILEGAGGTGAEIRDILKAAAISEDKLIFDDDPDRLVTRLVKRLNETHKDHAHLHKKSK